MKLLIIFAVLVAAVSAAFEGYTVPTPSGSGRVPGTQGGFSVSVTPATATGVFETGTHHTSGFGQSSGSSSVVTGFHGHSGGSGSATQSGSVSGSGNHRHSVGPASSTQSGFVSGSGSLSRGSGISASNTHGHAIGSASGFVSGSGSLSSGTGNSGSNTHGHSFGQGSSTVPGFVSGSGSNVGSGISSGSVGQATSGLSSSRDSIEAAVSPIRFRECPEGQIRHIDGSCVAPEITRNVFVVSVPKQTPHHSDSLPDIPPPKVDHNILFVRLPEGGTGPDPIVVPPPRQDNIVYVLNKKNQGAQRVIEVPAPPPSEPEIYFVNYDDGENPTLPGGIDLQTALGSAAETSGQVLTSGHGDNFGNAEGTGGSVGIGNGFVGNFNTNAGSHVGGSVVGISEGSHFGAGLLSNTHTSSSNSFSSQSDVSVSNSFQSGGISDHIHNSANPQSPAFVSGNTGNFQSGNNAFAQSAGGSVPSDYYEKPQN